MAKHVFKGEVHHDGKKYQKGSLCPDDVLAHMKKIGVVEEHKGDNINPAQPEQLLPRKMSGDGEEKAEKKSKEK